MKNVGLYGNFKLNKISRELRYFRNILYILVSMLYGGFYLIKQVLRTNKPGVSTKREDIKRWSDLS